MPSVTFTLSNPRAANGQSYVDAYLGNGRTVLWDYTGTPISNATVTAVRFNFYGNVLRNSGTANVTMNGSSFAIALTATGETRQNCTCYASGAVMDAFAAASGTLTMALVMPSNAYFRASAATATLDVEYVINITQCPKQAGRLTTICWISKERRWCPCALPLTFGSWCGRSSFSCARSTASMT